MTKPRVIVVTGCDANHFHLAEDFMASIRAVHGAEHDVGFIRFCGTELPEAVRANADHLFDGSAGYADFRNENGFYVADQAFKALLPELFPGYEVYCWVDADCWFQTRDTVAKMAAFAARFDLCIHPDFDVHYRYYPTPSKRTETIYRRVYGAETLAEQPLAMPMVNTGVYAIHAGSRVWRLWHAEMAAMKRRFQAGTASFLCDQITLHRILYAERFNFFPLRATDNWQLYACRPGIDRARRLLTVPTPPYEPIGILHLAGASKDLEMATDAEGARATYRYRDVARYFGQPG